MVATTVVATLQYHLFKEDGPAEGDLERLTAFLLSGLTGASGAPALVLTGAGGAFSSGADISGADISGSGHHPLYRMRMLSDVALALHELPCRPSPRWPGPPSAPGGTSPWAATWSSPPPGRPSRRCSPGAA
jgi:hypothetical protein